MINLSKDDLIKIHTRIIERFKTKAAGINDEGLIDAIVKRPDQILYGVETFTDI
ncbi:MAG TPA: hypothetical protein VF884_05085 [Nitrososphaeraceae archaeon]